MTQATTFVEETGIPDLVILNPRVFKDKRGYFFESYNQKLLESHGLHYHFVQDNQAASTYGVLRGLHYQTGAFAQAKLVRVIEGVVLDVVVDLRKGSPTFGQSCSVVLSAKNKKQLMVPRGFAHGYIVLSETAEFFYKCDNYYSKAHEGGIIYNDPKLQIDWQVPTKELLISEKDKVLPVFDKANHDFVF